VNKVVLTYINALVRFLHKIAASVHRYEQDKPVKNIAKLPDLEPEVKNLV
jgi:hypothetical protein